MESVESFSTSAEAKIAQTEWKHSLIENSIRHQLHG